MLSPTVFLAALAVLVAASSPESDQPVWHLWLSGGAAAAGIVSAFFAVSAWIRSRATDRRDLQIQDRLNRPTVYVEVKKEGPPHYQTLEQWKKDHFRVVTSRECPVPNVSNGISGDTHERVVVKSESGRQRDFPNTHSASQRVRTTR